MGDRGNIVIEKDGSCFPAPVFFYTHWSGSEMKPLLQAALVSGKSRWNDSQYLARVIFCELLHGDKNITGYGITTRICDNSHPLLCVAMEERKVRERAPAPVDTEETLSGAVLGEWTFDEFVTAKFSEDEDEDTED